MQCTRCLKVPELCVCSFIQPQTPRTQILILQHPQEPDKDLGTARIAHLALTDSALKIGLSWPNLKAALGREAQPSQWGILYLGSGIKSDNEQTSVPLQWVSRNGTPREAPTTLTGIVVLDGTWSQAKALWWRNAWLLKLNRAVLNPVQKSLYRNLRKEPRRECLSTIESIAETLNALQEPVGIGEHLKSLFSVLLEKVVENKSRRIE